MFRWIFREMYGEEVTSKKLRGDVVVIHSGSIDVWLNHNYLGTIYYNPIIGCKVTKDALTISKGELISSTTHKGDVSVMLDTDDLFVVYSSKDNQGIVDGLIKR